MVVEVKLTIFCNAMLIRIDQFPIIFVTFFDISKANGDLQELFSN